MNRLKQLVFKSWNSLILIVISLLGFTTSCEDEEPRYMYGSPHATFKVTGKIVSAPDNKPIPDIIVQMRQVDYQDSTKSMLIETGFSNEGGSYDLGAYGDPHDQTYRLRFVDTDGPLNGQYETLDTTVVFKDPKFVNGDGIWYSGSVTKELDIKLKPKE